ncbi:putative glycolipid-binding domain-containing protein [Chitinophaga sp. MM2321]|uniref:putative glycolipid-binding domain-containing protein n=1 Tax=Chitinophaga sp. MM2321 TaxID=3137178 RepID=UPI0032D58AA3
MEPIIWQALKWPATEYFTLQDKDHHKLATGNINGYLREQPFCIRYEIEITPEWKVSSFLIQLEGPQPAALKLTSDLNGHWFDKEGNHVDAFDDCIDIDISLTPFTNTLPIRRLQFETGERKALDMLYIQLPEFELQKVQQHYTLLPSGLYLYENTSTGFQAELPMDKHGIMKDYPEIFSRIC